MNRRQFLEVSAAAVAAFPLLSRGAKKSAPYNVLIIQTDEHNFRTLGCYREVLAEKDAHMWGAPIVETPNLDALAASGVIADSFYTVSPVCSPSRATFVSGLYSMDNGVMKNDEPMNDSVETFAEVLERSGYATGYAGKWHLDGEPWPGWAPERKFGFADNRYMFNRGHFKKLELTPTGAQVAVRNAKGRPTYDVTGADETSFTTDWLADRTIEFVEAHRTEPFCYMVSIPDPHGPDTVRKPYDAMYAGQPFEVPYTADIRPVDAPAWGKPEDHPFDDAAYFGMVKCIDDNVGKILSRLDELGLREKTIVVFTSDHGDMRGEHGRQDKSVPFEASTKIPFILSAPGLVPAGRRTSVALSTVDFKPTLLGLLGVSARVPPQGRDASAVLRGSDDVDVLAFSRSPGTRDKNAWLMAVGGRYKLIASDIEPLWLIDLKNDPAELENRAEDPELKPVVARMAAALLDYAETYGDPNLTMGNMRESLEGVTGK